MRGWWPSRRAASRPWMLYSTLMIPIVLLVFLLSSPGLQDSLHLHDKAAVHTSVPYEDALLMNRSFTNLFDAYRQWDVEVGCSQFRDREDWVSSFNPSLQDIVSDAACRSSASHESLRHVSVLVKKWRWLPNNLENLYSCNCGLTCLWSKSEVLASNPDAVLYETATPPYKRRRGEPLRVYMDLEPGRKSSGYEDIFISYHAGDTLQATYAGASFHIHRSYYTSSVKRNDVLVYWSSSHCVPARMRLARELLAYLPHHSFGKCLNNRGNGKDVILRMYPECSRSSGNRLYWAYHLHCAMSHYKFVLAIENTMTESYVTEKLFYALDAGAIPIYFGAGNVLDMVPSNSIIDGSKFPTLEALAAYVKRVGSDPVLYAEYHAWRRCGVMGHYHRTRALSLDSLPCRLCSLVSSYGGKNYQSLMK